MRRALLALSAGAFLLNACGVLDTPTGAPAPTALAAVKTTCEVLGRAYEKNMGPFAESLTAYVADRKALPAAQKSLATFATAVKEATATSADAELVQAGQKSAETMQARSADAAFFAAIKTPADVDKTVGPTLTEWLSPVQKRCS
ncbi:hypothetical protein [Actinoplanes solisilvae]|uniref:hypothetical protein n=1 Tax=Actinoplanes solisilvae TaxID=2486853 RepID=UPI000FDCC100|nr:hypothetical protein [Actinoplanes solisilvae]